MIATPVYNYNVPAVLKAWIDHIVRKGLTLGSEGQGLVTGKKATLLLASGGVYTDGVPQNRKRLVMLGLRGRATVRFPVPTQGTAGRPHVSAASAIGDLTDAGEFGETGIYNHEPTVHSADMVARLNSLQPGRRERDPSMIDCIPTGHLSLCARAWETSACCGRCITTTTASSRSVRERGCRAFRMIFSGRTASRALQYRQVGNAVPPPMAAAFARCLGEQMEWSLAPKAYAGNPAGREPANVLSDDERRSLRAVRMRGASLGKLARSVDADHNP